MTVGVMTVRSFTVLVMVDPRFMDVTHLRVELVKEKV